MSGASWSWRRPKSSSRLPSTPTRRRSCPPLRTRIHAHACGASCFKATWRSPPLPPAAAISTLAARSRSRCPGPRRRHGERSLPPISSAVTAPPSSSSRAWSDAADPTTIARKEPIMPRVAPITGKSDVPAEHHVVVDAVVKVFGNVRGPFSMLLHSPKLAERVLPLVTFFRDESVVEPKLRSVAILTAVREREAAYVWAAQVAAARRNGLREEVIDLIRAKGDPGKLSAEEREIVIYVRQLMRTNRTDQAVFDALQKRYGVQWLVELTAAANYFALLSGIVNAFEVAAPPDGDKLPV